MSQARNRLQATVDHLSTLKIIIVVLLVIVSGQWWRVGQLQEHRRIYVPPNLTKGIVTTFDEVPPPVVYTFAYYIFQQLNRWSSDGEDDYRQQIYRLQAYLAPSCLRAFTDDMNEKRRLGELRQRVRMIQEISGQGFLPRRVRNDAPSAWTTWLDLNLRETIGNHEVKNVNLRYQLSIVAFDVDKEANPWGLALACDGKLTPQLLNDEDVKAPFQQREIQHVD